MSALEPNEYDFGRIGRRVRHRRQQLGMTATETARKAGITRQTLVRLESGKPCKLETLNRIRGALRLFLDYLLRDDPPFDFCVQHQPEEAHWRGAVKRSGYQKHGDTTLPSYEDDPAERLRLGRLGFQPFFTCLLTSELPRGILNQGVMEIYRETWVDSHPGEEFVYCLRGRARLYVRGEMFVLEEGGALTFNAVEPHQYAPADPLGPNDPPILLLIVVALPPLASHANASASGQNAAPPNTRPENVNTVEDEAP